MKTYSLEELKDKHIGKTGTKERDQYEFDLKLDVLGYMIKQARKKRNMTQEELGKLVGVKRAEISKLENSSRNMTIGTIIKIFNALKADIKFRIELDNKEWKVA